MMINSLRIISSLLLIGWSLVMLSCRKEYVSDCFNKRDVLTRDEWIHDQPANQGVANALEKAALVAGVEWVPLNPVPSVYASPYPAGESRQGLPYSLAQKVNGYVGLDVSFYTFLTALNNPRSVMYTENLKLPPYNSFDAAPYYGTVCATSVWYALGVKAPYYTSSINGVKALKKRDDLPPDSIQLCDVLWKLGHVAMIYDIARDINDSIKKVVVFETTTSAHSDSRLIEYDFEGFCNRWNNGGYMIYRPKDLSENPAAKEQDFRLIAGRIRFVTAYNQDLCPSRGDRVAYPVGDSVVINILSDKYEILELFKDGSLYQEVDLGKYISENHIDQAIAAVRFGCHPISQKDVVFSHLPYGKYLARLKDKAGHVSNFVSFEVVDFEISYVVGDKLTVYFSSSNATPEFMSLGDVRECPYYCTIFTPEQIAQGSATVALNSDYLKVFFRGDYGRVSNKIIKVR